MHDHDSGHGWVEVDGSYLADQARQALSLFFAPLDGVLRQFQRSSRQDLARYVQTSQPLRCYRPHPPGRSAP